MVSIHQRDSKLPLGTNRCKCSGCGSYFGGVGSFDLHRIGPADDRRCLAPAVMSDRGLRRQPRGYWVRNFDAGRPPLRVVS